MDQITALKELAEKVEAGDYKTMGDTNACAKAFGKHPHPDAQYAINAWNRGSLDAAHSLHKAVLGDRWICFAEYHFDGLPSIVKMQSKKTGRFVEASHPIAARAHELAIIKAKIAEMEQ